MAPQREEHCYRCGYVWRPRLSRVRICARCKSPYFWFAKVRVPTRGRGPGIAEIVGPKRGEVLRLARKFGATNVRIFGSVARNDATPTSDVDVLVDPVGGGRYRPIDLALALTRTLGRRVDLVDEGSLFWLIQPRVVAEAIPV